MSLEEVSLEEMEEMSSEKLEEMEEKLEDLNLNLTTERKKQISC